MGNRRLKDWHAGRIVYYQDQADAVFWDKQWKELISKEYYQSYERGNLDVYAPMFLRYFKKDDLILEAGCGTGKYVLALKSRGFTGIEGIEWGEKTVRSVKNIYPDLPIKVGDVTNLQTPNNYYNGYISLGVVEHTKEGPECFLKEAYRILKPGGHAIISVPYVNPLRRLKARLGLYKVGNQTNLSFYQYAFSKKEFIAFLERTGFVVVEVGELSGAFGLYDEFPMLFILPEKIPGFWKTIRFLNKFYLLNYFGHMACFVCIKP